jgi:hypothetical protein
MPANHNLAALVTTQLDQSANHYSTRPAVDAARSADVQALRKALAECAAYINRIDAAGEGQPYVQKAVNLLTRT